MNNFINIFLDYLRLVSYAIIILSALKGILKRRFNDTLFVGDILMCLALFFAGLYTNVLNKNGALFADILLTPAAVFWAIIHFYNMVRKNGNTWLF